MREVRAWDIKNKCWLNGFLVSQNLQVVDDGGMEEEGFIVLLSTGEKDEGKVDIFEGDILIVERTLYLVEFDQGKFVLTRGLGKEALGDLCDWRGLVVGNLYEHPLLMVSSLD